MKPFGKKLGEGLSSQVYELSDDTSKVVKLFIEGYPQELIGLEARITEMVYEAGVPSPRNFGTVRLGSRTGIVFEKIVGTPLIRVLPYKVHLMNSYASLLADIHAGIHRANVSSLPTQKELYKDWISATPYLTRSKRAKVLAIMEELPEGNKLCHNDLHPNNILITKSGPVVIDWTCARMGDPLADVAYSEMIIRMGDLSIAPVGRLAVVLGRGIYSRLYRMHYINKYSGSKRLMKSWLPVLAAARLIYEYKSERPVLLDMLNKLI
ncbi:MAG TPA: aminoglycoside phosphotransferase family protein [Caldisericia bacterium]|nr:aminoglycoside phosphotransferase family protein [Caldisericia bacterium]HPF49244.1 aminoglycoside phosphotransferase family protein [Caldisericia bacterium]HPI84076.1 aminoglycoside phosphotransferase family protein [Caldisericia bacterium]HPQ93334.1 aminoglycoside phosphotransferase family protein [Caldisericia bacterium]HRV75284.1 aminoglycoside phosphotransferase family protein [Caldisericia bacterium]